MFSVSNIILTLSLLATVFDGAAARPTGLRRRCAASKSAGAGGAINVGGAPTASTPTSSSSAASKPTTSSAPKMSGCFPSVNFNTPDLNGKSAPSTDLSDWWCSRSSEYAFLGFSYAVDQCPSKSQLTSDFKKMNSQYDARYVRIYASCDDKNRNFYDDVVEAAYEANMGVFALAWFGYDGTDAWKGRLQDIVDVVNNNPLAPYVIRNIAVGSEALYDNDLSGSALASVIKSTQSKVNKYGIQVTTSDMGFKWTANQVVIDAVSQIQSNTLPFFNGDATTGGAAWGAVQSDLNTYAKHAAGKKIYLTQTGWPSNQSLWKANSASAVSSVGSEAAYFSMLDSKCSALKNGGPQGGVGWFMHAWDDSGLPGWGLMSNGKAKFDFSPRTSC